MDNTENKRLQEQLERIGYNEQSKRVSYVDSLEHSESVEESQISKGRTK